VPEAQEGCGAQHPHIDVRCNFHAGDGKHRHVDEWGTLDSWPLGLTLLPGGHVAVVARPRRTVLVGGTLAKVGLIAAGTMLAGALAIIAFMTVATYGAIS